ncbi:Lrp/AsnC family transcriptional regulator [Rubrimonas cliftonensis]|uniref:Transcriptional regulator, AsnC family n=1 Tax=Rubrimonas cliftonensis TaxID=89524 RepID=A0A1H4DN02_9RHOB|nr:Lrp/AsnC family transcriptional regulator [Rubrimonas cliftonensis]SEA74135.1 transcriptional regulator, AsnC family [Rubrimonas cliftonensis]
MAERRLDGIRLDGRDRAILAVLRREGRITNAELARRVNLSPTPCWARVRRLEQAGVITGYVARVAPEAFGRRVTAVVTVELESHRAEDFARFEAHVQGVPAVFDCAAVGGGVDYVMKVSAADVAAYQAEMDRLLEAGVGVKRYFTYFVTKPVKEAPPPLDGAEDSSA